MNQLKIQQQLLQPYMVFINKRSDIIMEAAKNFNVEVDDFMSLIYSGNSVFIDLLLIMIFIDNDFY